MQYASHFQAQTGPPGFEKPQIGIGWPISLASGSAPGTGSRARPASAKPQRSHRRGIRRPAAIIFTRFFHNILNFSKTPASLCRREAVPRYAYREPKPSGEATMGAFVLFLLGLAIALVVLSVKIVPQGMEYTVLRFGKYTNTMTPGLNIIMPVIDMIGVKMNMREQVMDVPSQEIITKDNAMVRVDGVIFYQVIDAAKAAYEVSNLNLAIIQLTMTNIRTVMGSMDLDELLSKRDEINTRLLTVVDDATTPWGVKVTRIEIKDIAPPKDLVDAMGRQMKAEREKRAVILEAEGLRQSEILKAEGQKQARVLEAEGRKEAAFRDADARERLAQAEARATLMVSEAIAKGDIQAVNYFVAQKYVEALQHVASAPNSKIVLMPLEASSVIGALGGIAELTKHLKKEG
jgi:regulator of protease activity HflC (stomatin/prohibitin superfamily)